MRYLVSVIFIFTIIVTAIDVLQSDITKSPDVATIVPDATTSDPIQQEVVPLSKENVINSSNYNEALSVVTNLAKKLGALEELSDILLSKKQVEEALTRHPELAGHLQDIILDPATKPRAQLALIHSLSVVGGPHAEHVLIKLATETTITAQLRLQAIASMAELSTPSSNVLNSLWRISEEESTTNQQISESALLNLGIAAHTTASTLPDTSHQIVERLLSLTEEAFADNSPSFSILLESLANSGSKEGLPLAHKLLQNPSPEIRALGVSTIRLMQGKEIEEQIISVAEHDASAIPRSAALEAIHLRQPNQELISRLGTLLFEEEDKETRRKIITYLGERATAYPESKNKLRELLSKESDQENYELAVRFIS